MKIALINIYNGEVDRGAETFVKELASRLAKDNTVTVYQGGNESDTPYHTKRIKTYSPNFQSSPNPYLSRIFLDSENLRILLFSLKLLPSILTNRYDIILPVNGGWLTALIRLATWIMGKKMVVSGQSGMGWTDRINLWCFPDTFVALSSKAAIWAKKVNSLIRVEYIPNGTDIGKFKPIGERYLHGLTSPVVLCAGALTATKRIDLVIKAVAETENLSLLVVGRGEEQLSLQNLGNKLLGAKRFKIIQVPYTDMPKVFRSADVFTLVSEPYYSFEIVITEAMATGLPVVVNEDEIRKEIVGEAGVLIDPFKPKEYSLALENAVKNSKILSRNSLKQVRHFDWDSITKKYELLFKSLMYEK